jgi:hypothetical protein
MNNSVTFNSEDNTYIFNCPQCYNLVQVSKAETNCLIFRHGIYKQNFTQINPHLPKTECDKLVELDLIYGCGKPFKLIRNSTNEIDRVEICEYI